MLTLNLRPTYLVTSAALPHLVDARRRRGRLRLVPGGGGARSPAPPGTSRRRRRCSPSRRRSRSNTRPPGVRCNTVLPSVIDTPANRAAQPDADYSRWVQPAEIAAVIRFLAGPESGAGQRRRDPRLRAGLSPRSPQARRGRRRTRPAGRAAPARRTGVGCGQRPASAREVRLDRRRSPASGVPPASTATNVGVLRQAPVGGRRRGQELQALVVGAAGLDALVRRARVDREQEGHVRRAGRAGTRAGPAARQRPPAAVGADAGVLADGVPVHHRDRPVAASAAGPGRSPASAGPTRPTSSAGRPSSRWASRRPRCRASRPNQRRPPAFCQ